MRCNNGYKFNEPVDLVFCWVDGNDPKHKASKTEWQKRLGLSKSNGADLGSSSDIRYIDHQELRYALRSAAENAPWINRIFIVTKGQAPSWLIQDNPKITVIDEKQIMPQDALPTFNSEAVETCLCNIPGLSEYFLYANDDMFIGQAVTPDYFFDRNGNPIVRLGKQFWSKEDKETTFYPNNILFSANLIKNKFGKDYSEYEPCHNIDAYRKSYFKECRQCFLEDFDKTCRRKFRQKGSIQRHIISLYMMAVKKCSIRVVWGGKRKSSKRKNLFITLQPDNAGLKVILENHNPVLFCINDADYTNHTDDIRIKSLLAELFPKRQAWEKEEDYTIKPLFTGKNARAIVFACDNKFCKYFAAALKSLIENSNNENLYDIIVFESDISRRNKKLLLNMIPNNFSLRFIDLSEFRAENECTNLYIHDCRHWSQNVYNRIFIPVLMRDYERVLWCDSDIVFNGEMETLFNTDFEENEIMAVSDIASPSMYHFTSKRRFLYLKEELGIKKPELYFNGGVIMFNTQVIDPITYLEEIKKILASKKLEFQDQDLLNMVFQEKCKHISRKWNFQWQIPIYRHNWINLNFMDAESASDYWKSEAHPHIIHFADKFKPWDSPYYKFAEVFWRYARQTDFYEEILLANQDKSRDYTSTLKNLNLKKKIYFDYYRCKLLSCITFGEKKEHYLQKRKHLKERVKEIRNYAKL